MAMESAVADARHGLGVAHTGHDEGDECACDMRRTCGPVAWGVLHSWAKAVNDQICSHCGEFAQSMATFMHDLVNAKLGKPLHDPYNFAVMCGKVYELQASASQGGALMDGLRDLIPMSQDRGLRGSSKVRRRYAASFLASYNPQPARARQARDPWGSRCRDPETGRWISGEDCPPIPDDPFTPAGDELTWAIGPNSLQRYEFVYRVVEVADLIPSHDPFTFAPNPAFPPDLQPRLRERTAPRVQVERIAARLDTRLLLEEFRSLDRGAPIVGPDMVVESGNGRVMAMIRAAADFPDSYRRYRIHLEEVAPAFGQSAEDVRLMATPVLVRERVSDVVRVDFVEEANATSSISRSTVEIARTDADNITVDMLDQLQVLDGESIEDALRARRNRAFMTRFLATLPAGEQAGLVDADGVVSQDGVRRAGTAVFVRAFGTADAGFRLAERWFETTEPDLRNVFNGMARALGPLARAEALAIAGERDPGLSIAQDLAEVITVYSKIKRSRMPVEEYLAQASLLERELNEFQEQMLTAIDERRRSARRIGELLRTYGQLVIDSPQPEQIGLLGDLVRPAKEDLWEQAIRRTVDAPPQAELIPMRMPRRLRMRQSVLGEFGGSVVNGAGFGVGAALAGMATAKLFGIGPGGERVKRHSRGQGMTTAEMSGHFEVDMTIGRLALTADGAPDMAPPSAQVDFLVDTGASWMALPLDVIERLGLPQTDTVDVLTAEGTVRRALYSAALAYNHRVIPVSVVSAPEPLLGSIPLEILRLTVNPVDRVLEPGPFRAMTAGARRVALRQAVNDNSSGSQRLRYDQRVTEPGGREPCPADSGMTLCAASRS